ncbi:hypothetical protein ACFC1B_06985 [Streptomyces xiamenensis]|uniref:hypothetical protein n=1 Tax=Streptomyces xiamenensis TaxID=408015 RepID=UPI0035DA8A8C
MSESPTEIQRAAAALLRAFRSLGAEHQTLVIELSKTEPKERRGTLSRMMSQVREVGSSTADALEHLAAAHGSQDLGIAGQCSTDEEGNAYHGFGGIEDVGETLFMAALSIKRAVDNMEKAYAPTRKYPHLAVARHPEAMRQVLAGLREALTALGTEAAATDPEDGVDVGPLLVTLDELESRICRIGPDLPLPRQEDVVRAVLTDPGIEAAVVAALNSRPSA